MAGNSSFYYFYIADFTTASYWVLLFWKTRKGKVLFAVIIQLFILVAMCASCGHSDTIPIRFFCRWYSEVHSIQIRLWRVFVRISQRSNVWIHLQRLWQIPNELSERATCLWFLARWLSIFHLVRQKHVVFQIRNYFGLKFGQMAIFHVVHRKHVVFSNSE